MRILLLDVDGVLQTSACPQFVDMEVVPALVSVLEKAGDIRVVVSSTHREGRSLGSLKDFFPEPLREYIVGATPVLPLGRANGGRQREIEAWIATTGYQGSFVTLDDEWHLFDADCTWLIPTHPHDGLFGAPLDVLEDWAFSAGARR